MSAIQSMPSTAAVASRAESSLDFKGLASLKNAVKTGENTAKSEYRKVAEQFEALFIQQMLKQSRESAPPTIFDSQQTRLAQSLRDEQMATQLASPGLGLAQMILDQITGQRDRVAAASANRDTGTTLSGQSDASTALTAGQAATGLRQSRLPGLRSALGDVQGVTPQRDAIGNLIATLTRTNGALAERVQSAIQGAPEHIRGFVNQMRDAARLASSQSGVPEKLILSQAALESGWGQREIRAEDGSNTYNLFGIKATSNWKGKVVNITTTEYIDGEPRKLTQPFRAYNSYAEAFADYARLLGSNDRYSEVVKAPNAEEAARRVQAAGYATDPAYAEKLIAIMGYFETTGGRAVRSLADARTAQYADTGMVNRNR